jgi:hypothetical protein
MGYAAPKAPYPAKFRTDLARTLTNTEFATSIRTFTNNFYVCTNARHSVTQSRRWPMNGQHGGTERSKFLLRS